MESQKLTQVTIKNIFACPRCKTYLKVKVSSGRCPNCKFGYKKENGIWDFLYTKGKRTLTSLSEYESSHRQVFGKPNDGSYEILASFAKGNKSLDIACGQGYLEHLAPETVGVEFSVNALNKAQKMGIKNLVLADAHHLPFRDNSFDICICHGSLEHFEDPQRVIYEMARVSKIQILTVHKALLPFLSPLYSLLKNQPIEKPINFSVLSNMLKKAGLHIVFKGVWSLPVNYGRPIKFLPEFKRIPSCWFVISIKK